MKTSLEWQEELKKRLGPAMTRAAKAAAMRAFFHRVVSENLSDVATDRGYLLMAAGKDVSYFPTIEARTAYITRMTQNAAWVDHTWMLAIAKALDVTLVVQATGSDKSDAYNYKSTQANAPVFHIRHVNGNHWEPVVGGVTIPVPGDGNCGAHALAVLTEAHFMGSAHSSAEAKVLGEKMHDDSLLEFVKEDSARIQESRQFILTFLKTLSKTDTLALIDKLSKINGDTSSDSNGLGEFFKGLDKTADIASLKSSIASRISLGDASMSLASACLSEDQANNLTKMLNEGGLKYSPALFKSCASEAGVGSSSPLPSAFV